MLERKAPQNTISIVQTIVTYCLIKAVGTIPTQPLAVAVAEQQKFIKLILKSTTFVKPLSLWRAGKQVVMQDTAIGLWRGTIPSVTRESFKSAYKGFLLSYSQDYAKTVLTGIYTPNPFAINMFAGVLSGSIDATISSPIERYKTWRLTGGKSDIPQDTKSKLPIVNFFKSIEQQYKDLSSFDRYKAITSELFRGLAPTVIKQSVMMGSLFQAKHVVSNTTKNHVDNKTLRRFIDAVGPGMITAFFATPFDLAKTFMQANIGKSDNLWVILSTTYQRLGIRGLAVGLPGKLLLTTFGYTINSGFLDMIQNQDEAAGRGRH